MIFSLIVPTIHRTTELERLLKSLADQKTSGWDLRNDMEVLVVDQNPDDRLMNVLGPYRDRLTLVHLKAPPLGQSNAKNVGLRQFKGRYVGFPDDDCYYAEDTLSRVFTFFRDAREERGLFGRALDLETGTYLLKYPESPRVIRGAKNSDAFLGLQIAQFYTDSMVKSVGDFDVDLCSGGKWGSGEETDFALRCLQVGFPIEFRPEVIVYHPLLTPQSVDDSKLRRYSIGYGALCRKRGLYGLLCLKTLKQFTGFLIFFLLLRPQKAKVNWITATARLRGFFDYGVGEQEEKA